MRGTMLRMNTTLNQIALANTFISLYIFIVSLIDYLTKNEKYIFQYGIEHISEILLFLIPYIFLITTSKLNKGSILYKQSKKIRTFFVIGFFSFSLLLAMFGTAYGINQILQIFIFLIFSFTLIGIIYNLLLLIAQILMNPKLKRNQKLDLLKQKNLIVSRYLIHQYWINKSFGFMLHNMYLINIYFSKEVENNCIIIDIYDEAQQRIIENKTLDNVKLQSLNNIEELENLVTKEVNNLSLI